MGNILQNSNEWSSPVLQLLRSTFQNFLDSICTQHKFQICYIGWQEIVTWRLNIFSFSELFFFFFFKKVLKSFSKSWKNNFHKILNSRTFNVTFDKSVAWNSKKGRIRELCHFHTFYYFSWKLCELCWNLSAKLLEGKFQGC